MTNALNLPTHNHPSHSSSSSNQSPAAQGIEADLTNNLGYGLGKIAKKVLDSLSQSWQRIWTQEPASEAMPLRKISISQTAPKEKTKRDLLQGGAFPAVFDLGALDGTNGFKVYGLLTGSQLGFSVDTAGDINDDGLPDLVLGANKASPGGRTSAGAAYILFGQITGWPSQFVLSSLDGTNGFRWRVLLPMIT